MDGFRGDSLVYANDSAGALRHVDEVANGSACGCTCPACGQPLIARNGGSVRAHHFAHEGGSCDWAAEAVVSLIIQDVVLDACSMCLPEAPYFDEEASEWRVMPPSGPVAVTGVRQVGVPGRDAPCAELSCSVADGRHWKVNLVPCLSHPLTSAQVSSFSESGVLVVAIDMKSAREGALDDEGRHYSRDEAFALMQKPAFIGSLLANPSESVTWAVNGPLEAERARQGLIRYEREAEARKKRLEREASELAESKRREKEEEARRKAEEAARKREEAEWRSQRVEAEVCACERHGHTGLSLVRKGMKDFAVDCPLHGEADTVMQCGAYSYSTVHCQYCVRKKNYVLECAHPDAESR